MRRAMALLALWSNRSGRGARNSGFLRAHQHMVRGGVSTARSRAALSAHGIGIGVHRFGVVLEFASGPCSMVALRHHRDFWNGQ